MRGASLREMVHELRIEARYDPDPALSVNMVPLLKQTIKRTQEFLYDEFDWPFLRTYRDIAIEAGSRFYDFPNDMNLERVEKIDYFYNGQWQPVERRIDLCDYNSSDSDAGERRDPVLLWDIRDTGEGPQIELWPIPISNGKIRLTGIRALRPLVEDLDRADLDKMMIILYAAGELLAGSKDPVAELKFQQAKARRDMMQSRVSQTRRRSFNLGGVPADPLRHERVTVVHVRTP